MEVCCNRLPNLSGKEFAHGSLSTGPPKEVRRNGLCQRGGPL